MIAVLPGGDHRKGPEMAIKARKKDYSSFIPEIAQALSPRRETATVKQHCLPAYIEELPPAVCGTQWFPHREIRNSQESLANARVLSPKKSWGASDEHNHPVR